MPVRSRVPAHARKPRIPAGAVLTGPPLLAVVLVVMVLTAGAPAQSSGRHAMPAARDVAVTGTAVITSSQVTAGNTDTSLADQEHALRTQAAALAWVTVRPGSSLSQIAAARCGPARDWTGLYKANRAAIGRDPDELQPGTRLDVSCSYVPGLLRAADPPVYQAAVAALAGAPSSTSLTSSYSAPQEQNPSSGQNSYEAGSTSSGSGFQACVISRESGGNAQVMNASDHYGLYQFSASTWAAYGGNPADFGDASVAEQNQVFDNAMATPGGAGNWSSYDGC